MEFVTSVAAIGSSDVLLILAQATDGLGRISKAEFVRAVTLIFVVAAAKDNRKTIPKVSEDDTSLHPIVTFGEKLFDVLHSCASMAEKPVGDAACLRFCMVAAICVSFTCETTDTRWKLPFMLHDPENTGYIRSDYLREYLFATSVGVELFDAAVAHQEKDRALAAKRRGLGYKPVSPAQAALLAPSKRTDDILIALHRAGVPPSGEDVAFVEGIPVPTAAVLQYIPDERVHTLLLEASSRVKGIVDDCKHGRLDTTLDGRDILTDFVLPLPIDPRPVKLSVRAYCAWLSHHMNHGAIFGIPLPSPKAPSPDLRVEVS